MLQSTCDLVGHLVEAHPDEEPSETRHQVPHKVSEWLQRVREYLDSSVDSRGTVQEDM